MTTDQGSPEALSFPASVFPFERTVRERKRHLLKRNGELKNAVFIN